jgi:hypothetical protein
MVTRFLDLFKNDEGKPVKVRVNTPIMIRPYGEETRPAEVGEVVTVSEKSWGDVADSVEFVAWPDGRTKPQAVVISQPKVERQEPPAEILELPGAFVTAWKLEHEAVCRRRELEIATEIGAQVSGWAIGLSDVEARAKSLHRAREVKKVAEEHLDAFNWRKFFMAKLECSQLLQMECQQVGERIDELQEVAFSAFSERLAPLGLHRAKAQSLYVGSALYCKFHQRVQIPHNGDLCLLGDGTGRAYNDNDLAQIIQFYRNARERRAEVAALLPEARKELANAKKSMRTVAQ